mgnify:CR=1 FL=1
MRTVGKRIIHTRASTSAAHLSHLCFTTSSYLFPRRSPSLRFPWMVEEWKFDTDSCGPGKFRGGSGYSKTLLCINDEIMISQMTDRHKMDSWGLNGGGVGKRGATLFKKDGQRDYLDATVVYGKQSPSKFSNISIKNDSSYSLSSSQKSSTQRCPTPTVLFPNVSR